MTAVAAPPARMPLAAHLREARTRAVRAAIALAVGAVVGFVLSDQILDVLRTPIEALAASRSATINYDTVTGAFELKMSIALFTAVIVSSPVWLFELFRFLAPGLTRREKRWAFGFLGAAAPLFLAGCATGFVLFPHMVELLAGFASTADSTVLDAAEYVGFVMKLVVATGIAFVLPVFVVMLNLLGVVSAASIRRRWRFAVIAIVVFSALVTPAADVLSMVLVALPMAGLFAAAAVIATVHDRRVARARQKELTCSA